MEQINVHFLIPRAADDLISLFRITVEFLERAHPDAVVNFFYARHLPSSVVVPGEDARRRFVQGTRVRASSSTSSGAASAEPGAIFRLIEPEAIRYYKPPAGCAQDPEETIWHRFPCGTLATFCNAFVPLSSPSSCRAPTTPPPR